MPNSSPLNERERADLVAWLDGELEGEAARAEADALRKTWELLDYLPRPEPSASFTHRTLSRLAPARGAVGRPCRCSRSGRRGGSRGPGSAAT